MKRILIIDDDTQFLGTLRKMLVREGYTVDEAIDGKTGMVMFQSFHPDLIITDLIMPNRDGVETISELKSFYPGVRIIAMSGGDPNNAGLQNYPELAMNFGADVFLPKPLDRGDLIANVRKLIN